MKFKQNRTAKRIRRGKSICCCNSPFPDFSWYEEDIWTEIAKHLDGKSLMMLGTTNKWFHHLIKDDSIWKFACLRDLQLPEAGHTYINWIKLYASAFDGSHSFMFRQQEKHIDWMRIGAFFLDSPVALLAEKLNGPLTIPQGEASGKTLESCGFCILNNIKTGIWIADLQLVRCPVCDLNTCDDPNCKVRSQRATGDVSSLLVLGLEAKLVGLPTSRKMYKACPDIFGTMQTLDARHIELFLSENYRDGSWEYHVVGSHDIKKHADGAAAAIFDFKHLNDYSTSEIFNLKSWVGKANDWQPKAMITLNAVAINTNLQENEGLHVKYQAMKAGPDGEIVSLRISQQLL